MTCKQFLERMYLKGDELDANERVALERHRSECADCAAEYARVDAVRKAIHVVKSRPPRMADPLLCVNVVIGRIETEEMNARTHTSRSAIDRWIIRLSAPTIRAAMAGLLLLISGSFVAEYTSGFVAMKRLEEAIERSSSFHERYESAGMMDQRNLVDAAAEFLKLNSGKHSYLELSDNWIVMNKQSFKQIVLLYKELKDNPSQLPPEIREANPELAKLLEIKPDSSRLELQLNEREALIRELNRLLPKERKLQ